jgi:dTDP-L-rhamnose 4-epimerase
MTRFEMKKETVFITGGAGFIGTQLCRELISLNSEIEIVLYDNLHPQVHGKKQTFHPEYPQIKFIKGDIQNADELTGCLKLTQPTVIYHLAAETGTGQSYDEPVRYCSVNVGGTANLIEGIRAIDSVKKVILAGSRAVYGEGAYTDKNGRLFGGMPRTSDEMANGNFNTPLPKEAVPPFSPAKSDDRLPPMPASIYASTKLMQEYLLTQAAENAQWKCAILRFQNVYGAGQSLNNPYTGVLSIFAKKLMSGESLSIFEDGMIARDFVYVDDVARALSKLKDVELNNGEIIDIGYGEPSTILEVAQHLSTLLGMDPEKNKINGQFRAGDIRYACANIEKAKQLLNWEPQIPVDQGLERLVTWVKSQD